MESESARIRKQLLEFENGKFRMNERMPRDLGGLRSLAVARKRTPRPNAKRLEDCEKGWNNAFTKGLHSPPPPASPRSPAASKGKWAAPDSSSPTPSASQDGKYMRRWTDHWRSVSDMDGNWRGKSSARIESQTQRAMNAKILEAEAQRRRETVQFGVRMGETLQRSEMNTTRLRLRPIRSHPNLAQRKDRFQMRGVQSSKGRANRRDHPREMVAIEKIIVGSHVENWKDELTSSTRDIPMGQDSERPTGARGQTAQGWGREGTRV
ncbi:hypothetical protein AXG93_2423s1150 [Marchantia polymorpha subsp. ruderalis]|uniref:Uncharacterized protein n=1 Tax=Marchantia polymorpha subsp. ruderalis TaxID=1480154 RepID=A0A176VNP2_MARPO|nr:hypothetical protein AXG93_2423s1150 [Marchantia polymorpha subsp. ruderalis]